MIDPRLTLRHAPTFHFCHPRCFPFPPAVSKIASPGLTGNRLGAALTIPVVIIGVTSGLKRAYQRHLGYLDNGEECFYPNYKKDDYTPYFMKHKVSDRHLA